TASDVGGYSARWSLKKRPTSRSPLSRASSPERNARRRADSCAVAGHPMVGHLWSPQRGAQLCARVVTGRPAPQRHRRGENGCAIFCGAHDSVAPAPHLFFLSRELRIHPRVTENTRVDSSRDFCARRSLATHAPPKFATNERPYGTRTRIARSG